MDDGEERWTSLGMARDRLLLVAYMIISARAAELCERLEYYDQNAR